jgi:transcriptional regulator with XRE-family HTH domain
MPLAPPPVRRRLVGRTLRRHRETLGWTLDDAARVLECDRWKISRIETGERGIRLKELRELMEEYDVAEEQQAVLALLADRRGAFGWYPTTPTSCPELGGITSSWRRPPRRSADTRRRKCLSCCRPRATRERLRRQTRHSAIMPPGSGRRKRCWRASRRS